MPRSRKALRSAATGDGASSAVLIRGLRKQYETGKVALHDLWLAIEKGECFGLLGGCQSLPLVARMFRRTRAMRATDRPPFGAAMERAALGRAARRSTEWFVVRGCHAEHGWMG
jgi:hypothetical protein